MSKILYLFDAGDWESRMEVAHGARQAGFDVVIGLINGDESTAAKAPDFKIIPLRKASAQIGVVSTLKFIAAMRMLIRAERPDIIHVVTLKYSFMAGVASLWIGYDMRKIFTMAGLGYVFRSDAVKSKILRCALSPFLKFTFRRPRTTLIFQNKDDLNLCVNGGYVRSENAVLIKGSGVYLDRFAPDDGVRDDPPVILMPTRLVHEKGVAIFVEAARILKARGVNAVFQIAGGETTHNPKAISKDEMISMVADGAAQWLGRVEDLPTRLARSTMVVYPSYYGEGIPRVLLEACAASKAIVTTDHPGCREAVQDGVNGRLVHVKDAMATADAIEYILSHPKERAAMEHASRERAEKEFDIHHIAHHTIAVYGACKKHSQN